MNKVVLFGNGQTASTIYAYLTHDSPYDVVGFTVDRDYMQQESLFATIVPFEDVNQFFRRMTTNVGLASVINRSTN